MPDLNKMPEAPKRSKGLELSGEEAAALEKLKRGEAEFNRQKIEEEEKAIADLKRGEAKFNADRARRKEIEQELLDVYGEASEEDINRMIELEKAAEK